ncbi:MAG: TIGR00730 family Rossman fold protein, partial [Verrucomicrobiota bacterium]
CGSAAPFIEEMITTALKIGHDDSGRAELKQVNRALKEMRYANKVFAPYGDCRKIAVFGSARTKPEEPEYQAAEEFSRKIAERGFMVITGAGPGIMQAAQEGAGADDSFGLRIQLPFEAGANDVIEGDPKLINFKYFFTRKLSFVKEAQAAALFPGGFGTMDEGFETLTLMQTGKAMIFPVVLVDAPGGTYWKTFTAFLREHLLRLGLISENDFSLFKVFDDVDAAVEEVSGFYRVFNSYRYVRDKLVIRLNQKLPKTDLDAINGEFGDLLISGKFTQTKALPEERNEKELADLPRLVCRPDRGNYGRMRQLIDAINQSDVS